jgi:hypothetical protein
VDGREKEQKTLRLGLLVIGGEKSAAVRFSPLPPFPPSLPPSLPTFSTSVTTIPKKQIVNAKGFHKGMCLSASIMPSSSEEKGRRACLGREGGKEGRREE